MLTFDFAAELTLPGPVVRRKLDKWVASTLEGHRATGDVAAGDGWAVWSFRTCQGSRNVLVTAVEGPRRVLDEALLVAGDGPSDGDTRVVLRVRSEAAPDDDHDPLPATVATAVVHDALGLELAGTPQRPLVLVSPPPRLVPDGAATVVSLLSLRSRRGADALVPAVTGTDVLDQVAGDVGRSEGSWDAARDELLELLRAAGPDIALGARMTPMWQVAFPDGTVATWPAGLRGSEVGARIVQHTAAAGDVVPADQVLYAAALAQREGVLAPAGSQVDEPSPVRCGHDDVVPRADLERATSRADGLDEQLSQARSALGEAHAAYDELAVEHAETTRLLEDVREQLRVVVASGTDQAGGDAGGDALVDDVELADVAAAVRSVAPRLSRVRLTERALESAERSCYHSPATVVEELRALDRLLVDMAEDPGGGGMRERAAAAGLTSLRTGVSYTALSRYPSDYELTLPDGRQVTMGPHLRRGVGAATEVLRVYFWVDTDAGVAWVGHVGRKLRDGSLAS